MRLWCDHKSAIRNVRTATRLVWPQDVRANNMSILFGNVRMRIGSKPVSERFVARHFWIERVGVTRCDYGVKNIPDRVAIRFCCLTNIQHERKDLTSEDRHHVARANQAAIAAS